MPNIGQGKITTVFDHKLRPAKIKTVSPTGLKTEQLLCWRLMAGFDGNLWPPASSSTFDWSDLTVTQPLVATSRKCHQMARRKPTRPVRNHRPAVGVCREPSLWKSNSSGWFWDSQSLLCRAQEKNKSFDRCCSHSLYCHEQFHWVRVSRLSHLTLYTRLDPLFQRNEENNNSTAILVLSCYRFNSILVLCESVKPKLKL